MNGDRARHIRAYINFRPSMGSQEAHSELKDLVERLRKHGISVEFKSYDVLYDYGGMNWIEAREMGFPMPDDTIYISINLTPERQLRNLRHEVREARKRLEGWKYWPAHKYAEAQESKDVNLRGL